MTSKQIFLYFYRFLAYKSCLFINKSTIIICDCEIMLEAKNHKSLMTTFLFILLIFVTKSSICSREVTMPLRQIDQNAILNFSTMATIIQSIDQSELEDENIYKLRDLYDYITKSNGASLMTQGILFYVTGYLKEDPTFQNQFFMDFQGGQYFSHNLVTRKKFIDFLCSVLHKSENKAIKPIQMSATWQLVPEDTLNNIVEEINKIRKLKYGLTPFERATQEQKYLEKFFDEEKATNFRLFAEKGGMNFAYIQNESGPLFFLRKRVIDGCEFCWMVKQGRIAIVGKKQGRIYEIYYALLDQPPAKSFGYNIFDTPTLEQLQPYIDSNTRYPSDTKIPEATPTPSRNTTVPSTGEATPSLIQGLNITKLPSRLPSRVPSTPSTPAVPETPSVPQTPNRNIPEVKEVNSDQEIYDFINGFLDVNFDGLIPFFPSQQNQKEEQTDYNSIKNKKIVNTDFQNIGLYHQIPSNFIHGQVYTFRGEITKKPTGKPTEIKIVFRDIQTNKQINCVEKLPANQRQFQVPCRLYQTGSNFYMSVFPGQFGKSSPKRKVISQKGENEKYTQSAPSLTSAPELDFIDNKLILAWKNPAGVAKVIVTQGSQKVEQILSNYPTEYAFNVKLFGNFVENRKVKVELALASSGSGGAYGQNSPFSSAKNIEFTPTAHHYDDRNEDKIQIDPYPWRVEVGDTVKITGKVLDSTHNKLFLLTPSNQFQEYSLSKSTLYKGKSFSVSIPIKEKGVYILQIMHSKGYATENRPIYSSLPYPLIPDFYGRRDDSLTHEEISRRQPTDPKVQRDLLLRLINEKRKEFRVREVQLDNEISKLAQYYAQDMAERGYISHYNPEGQGLLERARKFGLRGGSFGQNLATNSNLTNAHEYLCRSIGHLKNMVDPLWKTVGVGVAKNSIGLYYVVNEFSNKVFDTPASPEEPELDLRGEILEMVIETNQKVTREQKKLSQAMGDWHNSSAFDESMISYLKRQGFKDFNLQSLRMPNNSDLVNSLKRMNYFKEDKRDEVGVSIREIDGVVEIMVAFI